MDGYDVAALVISLISAVVAGLSYVSSRALGREAYAGAVETLRWTVRAKQIISSPHRPWTAAQISGSAYDLRNELKESLRDLAPHARPSAAELLRETIGLLEGIFEWREDDRTSIQDTPEANALYQAWSRRMLEKADAL